MMLPQHLGVSFLDKDKLEALKRATEDAKASLIPIKAPAGTPVARLQNALKALGNLHGDPTLTKVKVDGIVGPGTTKAVNFAIAQKYVVMSSFPRPELTVQHVRQFAAGIADAVEGAVRAGGGTVPPVSMVRKSSGGGRAAAYVPPPEAAPEPASKQWIWWVVGGGSFLLLLTVASAATKKRRAVAAT